MLNAATSNENSFLSLCITRTSPNEDAETIISPKQQIARTLNAGVSRWNTPVQHLFGWFASSRTGVPSLRVSHRRTMPSAPPVAIVSSFRNLASKIKVDDSIVRTWVSS